MLRKKILSVLFIVNILMLDIDSGFSQAFDDIFISADSLLEDLSDPDLVILQADSPDNFREGHIPDAVLIQADQFAVTRESLYYELPDGEYFQKQLIKSGIDQTSRIVISSGWDSFAHAFRLYVTLSYFGLENQVRILDGGIRYWNSRGFPVSNDSSAISAKENPPLELLANASFLVDRNWIKDHINDSSVTLIDGRRDQYYTGKEKGRYVRSGHIINAKNLTWTFLVDENFKLLPEDELAELYQQTGIKKDHTLVAYCHVGLRASVIYTIGKALGYSVRLYDGSYNEWDGLDPEMYPSE